ncbi:unnamed protein product [Schistosoma mattheei]|uniref:Uncharacterized protein n=1 Tax=Schistosoma mattheei TaxID=31246 RepID=A0A183PSC8_9TREM|nr:unnamed protein product [Schistosoma mattheei]
MGNTHSSTLKGLEKATNPNTGNFNPPKTPDRSSTHAHVNQIFLNQPPSPSLPTSSITTSQSHLHSPSTAYWPGNSFSPSSPNHSLHASQKTNYPLSSSSVNDNSGNFNANNLLSYATKPPASNCSSTRLLNGSNGKTQLPVHKQISTKSSNHVSFNLHNSQGEFFVLKMAIQYFLPVTVSHVSFLHIDVNYYKDNEFLFH